MSTRANNSEPRALIITAPGINCDLELAEAFELAGARSDTVLLARLLRTPSLVDQYDLVGFPGGFSYGDDVGAGRIMAQLIRQGLYPALAAALERGVPMIAPCNGFQIAVQAGLLPGPEAGCDWPADPAAPSVALVPNTIGRFRNCWTEVEIPTESRCIWTANLDCPVNPVMPSAHGEGRFVAAHATLDALERNGQVAMRYAPSDHFNGSQRHIAGICDASGLILGLMPHPERYTRWTQHPTWTRLRHEPGLFSRPTIGLQMFRNAVEHTLAVV